LAAPTDVVEVCSGLLSWIAGDLAFISKAGWGSFPSECIIGGSETVSDVVLRSYDGAVGEIEPWTVVFARSGLDLFATVELKDSAGLVSAFLLNGRVVVPL